MAPVHVPEKLLEFGLLVRAKNVSNLLAGLVAYHLVLRSELLREHFISVTAAADYGLEFLFLLGVQVEIVSQHTRDPLRAWLRTGSGVAEGNPVLVEIK